MATNKQAYYISYTLKINRDDIKELKELFPDEIESGVNKLYQNLEDEIAKIELASVSDVIGMIKDGLLIQGFQQLHYLINN